MEVDNIDADLYDYKFEHFVFSQEDFQVFTQFIDHRHFHLFVRRVDREEGWTENLKVMVHHLREDHSFMYLIGCSDTQEKSILVETDFNIFPSNKPVSRLQAYCLKLCPDPEILPREKFNEMFETDIVSLPRSLYACGYQNGKFYMYNEFLEDYYEIIRTIRHIIQVATTFTSYNNFYFIICAFDGYMLEHYNEVRHIPKYISENEYKGLKNIRVEEPNVYPILHKNKYVIGQATLKNLPYAINMLDRHYFFHNMYHSFRSWHQGVPFSKKENKIVHGAHNDRGTIYNYTDRRDILVNQRVYFESDAVSKDNIVWGGFICRSIQRNYKYILDTDGQVSTWDATAWKLNSGSIILKTNSGWCQWFYDDYQPFVHYVPIKDDFSDLQEKYRWCEEHQEECEKMIRSCKDLFQKVYRYHNIIGYTIQMLDKMYNHKE